MPFFNNAVIATDPVADPRAVVCGEQYRITVLTDRLLRLEYSAEGRFEDRATKVAVCRRFPVPPFRVLERGGRLEIITEHLHVFYDKQRFSQNGLSITVDNTNEWNFGVPLDTLKGTTRTLDDANGPIPLEEGLMSFNRGYSLVDDSQTLAFNEDGWVEPVPGDRYDLYFFGYGRDYTRCLQDFYRLSGPVPMLPRFALGNWWSRYHAYSDEEYRRLFLKFAENNVPFSVAVLDMDWHIVEVEPQFGMGWTGYTWNRKLFPDPAATLGWLHEHKLRTALNVHPKDGVRCYEEDYPAMAESMGIDPASGDPVSFDAADPQFMEAYFRVLHHPKEEQGVDFWWIDWQQSGGASKEGYSPLWMLNHYHFVDNARDGKRPLTFSRYAGIGSHRYPIGFSGDSHITWETLNFQPYFTATASNVGYSWWSHDIGGHMRGFYDDELETRWVQLGVFSPIMRLHSANNDFNSKEPWNFGAEYDASMRRFLRLRHQLVPYLYTMNLRNHAEGIPLIRPLYHLYPGSFTAYEYRNEYAFGSELLVSPITAPADAETRLGHADTWLPEGDWFDFFSGRHYKGGKKLRLFRGIDSMPVLAKAGAIVPLTAEEEVGNGVDNPRHLELRIFAGGDNTFVLYEDNDRSGADCRAARTAITFTWGQKSCLKIAAADGDRDVIPHERRYTVQFIGFAAPSSVTAKAGDVSLDVHWTYDEERWCVTAALPPLSTAEEWQLTLLTDGILPENPIEKPCFEVIRRAHMAYDTKYFLFDQIKRRTSCAACIGEISTFAVSAELKDALIEILTADQ